MVSATGSSERLIVVDGEEFSVSFEGRTMHATWVTGKVPDYGFSATPYDESISDTDLAQVVRGFLDQVGADGTID